MSDGAGRRRFLAARTRDVARQLGIGADRPLAGLVAPRHDGLAVLAQAVVGAGRSEDEQVGQLDSQRGAQVREPARQGEVVLGRLLRSRRIAAPEVEAHGARDEQRPEHVGRAYVGAGRVPRRHAGQPEHVVSRVHSAATSRPRAAHERSPPGAHASATHPRGMSDVSPFSLCPKGTVPFSAPVARSCTLSAQAVAA